jgi:hypothetical protein
LEKQRYQWKEADLPKLAAMVKKYDDEAKAAGKQKEASNQ